MARSCIRTWMRGCASQREKGEGGVRRVWWRAHATTGVFHSRTSDLSEGGSHAMERPRLRQTSG